MKFFSHQKIGKRMWKRKLMAWGMACAVVIGIFATIHAGQKNFFAYEQSGFGVQIAEARPCPPPGPGETCDPPATPSVPGAVPAVTLSSDQIQVLTAADAKAKQGAANQGNGIFAGVTGEIGGVISLIATLFFKLMAGILWFVLFWMGDLMDNTFILEGDIGEKLHSVWVIVRNFVNIFFAIALVVVAFLAVIGYGDESGNYGLKKFIPKMAMALIAVNFTFLACRLVLDVNNVLTTAIFSIPQRVTNLSDITPSAAGSTKTFKRFECLSQKASLTQFTERAKKLDTLYPEVINQLGGVCYAYDPEYTENGSAKLLPFSSDPNKLTKDKYGQAIILMGSSQFSKKDFVWAMATQFQGLHNLNRASQLLTPDFTNLTVSAIFSIIFAVIYGAAYIAMFIVLVGRMVVLWVTIMLSPLAAISIAIPDLLPEELNIQKKFLSHAFVPLKMAIPLSFGYILVSQMSLVINTNSAILSQGSLDLTGGGEFARDVSISTLMYGVASVAIIWMGVFMASKDVVGSGFVETIKSKVESAGSTVAKWPTYLPMFPFGNSHFSLQSAKLAFDTASAALYEKQKTAALKTSDDMLAQFGIVISDLQKTSREASGALGNLKAVPLDETRMTTLMRTIGTDPTKTKELTDQVIAHWAELTPQNKQYFAKVLAGKQGSGDVKEIQEVKNDKTKFAEAMERMQKPGNVTATAPAVSYAEEAGSFAGKKLTITNVEKINKDMRDKIGIKTEKGKGEVSLDDQGIEQVISWFKGLNLGGQKEVLTPLVDLVKTVPSFLEKSKTDFDLKAKIQNLFDKKVAPDTDTNTSLFSQYKDLFSVKDDEAKKELEAVGIGKTK